MSTNASTKNFSPAANFSGTTKMLISSWQWFFDEIGMGGFTPDDHYKQMTTWISIRQFIKKGQMILDSCVSTDGTLQ